MAKISPVSIKYMIYASFKAEGPLEKPDVIGALFGQTEGLLGSELEMRELQKEGKIGRIEVDLEVVDGKSVGEIRLPSALDKSETTLIAAALETIDRIGPTEAVIEINKVEDVRGGKREFILERAKKLLEGLEGKEGIGEMSRTLKEETRAAKIQEYGEEKLPAGDLSGEEVVVVEGRADVVNLLKNRVNNVIGMNGTKLPLEIAKLGKEKQLTLFVDGDRGGKLIARNVSNNANIVYIASAPDGKEVEELMGKEILMALRKRVSVDEFFRKNRVDIERAAEEVEDEQTTELGKTTFGGDIKEEIRKKYGEIKGTKNALLLDSNMDIIRKVSSKEVSRNVRNSKQKVFAVIIDGSSLGAIIEACDEMGVSYLAATNFSSFKGAKVNLISL
ncbi:MAG TPA: DNA primase DnaG [Candidatus Nanoarchaeia archaeon]|nr:DNA primase DnaG [Candidatus Nanoarchaeia archaeon]